MSTFTGQEVTFMKLCGIPFPTNFLLIPTLAIVLFFSCAQSPRQEGSEQDVFHEERDTIADTVRVAYLTGKFEPNNSPDFQVVPDTLTDRSGLLLRKEALGALTAMATAAAKEGHRITVLSATRNFEYQRGIWERKWRGETLLSNGKNAAIDYTSDTARARAILLYSSMPGTSRHHWGTDFDLNALDNAYFENGPGKALFQWLETNASTYGFCRPYTEKGEARLYGYEEEKWHWSFMPLSAPFTRAAAKKLAVTDIAGFEGSQTAADLKVIDRYVLGIAPGCLDLK